MPIFPLLTSAHVRPSIYSCNISAVQPTIFPTFLLLSEVTQSYYFISQSSCLEVFCCVVVASTRRPLFSWDRILLGWYFIGLGIVWARLECVQLYRYSSPSISHAATLLSYRILTQDTHHLEPSRQASHVRAEIGTSNFTRASRVCTLARPILAHDQIIMKDDSTQVTWSDSFTNLVDLEESLPIALPPAQSSPMSSPSPAVDTKSAVASLGDYALLSSSRTLQTLRTLPPAAIIVLFTPVVPVRSKAADIDEAPTDPFEVLGKALSRHHKRIRHVPFVPKVGLTATHMEFIAHSGAIVTVNCRTHGQRFAASDESLVNQRKFVTGVAMALRQHSVTIPEFLLDIECEKGKEVTGHENVIQIQSCDENSLRRVADSLFTSPA